MRLLSGPHPARQLAPHPANPKWHRPVAPPQAVRWVLGLGLHWGQGLPESAWAMGPRRGRLCGQHGHLGHRTAIWAIGFHFYHSLGIKEAGRHRVTT